MFDESRALNASIITEGVASGEVRSDLDLDATSWGSRSAAATRSSRQSA
jgi:hypothetical protein